MFAIACCLAFCSSDSLPKATKREVATFPRDLRERFGIRRYGFHGISHAHVMDSVAAHLGTTPDKLRIVSCHLGNGASAAASPPTMNVNAALSAPPVEPVTGESRKSTPFAAQ